MSNIVTMKVTSQDRSKGGKARAAKLSKEERSAIAKHASLSRKSVKGLLKATHSGILNIGGIELPCAVLENGKRVITQGGMNNALCRKGKNASTIYPGTALQLPNFLNADNLMEFVDEKLINDIQPIQFIHNNKGKAYGFEANVFTKVCEVYLKARRFGKLKPQQENIANQCEILMVSLARVGITALIDESTGYQKVRENNALQELFSKFIAEELQPWVKRFPNIFFEHLKRLYGLKEMKKTPSFAGHLINRWIYRELSPEIHEELKRLNPIEENGRRRHSHHQLLTQDIGCPALDKQIQKIITLMSVSSNREELEKFLEKSKEINDNT